MTVLGRDAIIGAVREGRIVIDPFELDYVSVNSVDVRLGSEMQRLVGADGLVDPYSDSRGQFLAVEPMPLGQIRSELADAGSAHEFAPGYSNDHPAFLLRPGHYLAATIEAIGSTPQSRLVPDIDSKSSAVRWGLTTALCAGRGDVGFRARWTLEIRLDLPTLLLVGTKIAQVRFTEVEGVGDDYGTGQDSYQPDGSLRQLPKPLKAHL